jgi:predicted peptidase
MMHVIGKTRRDCHPRAVDVSRFGWLEFCLLVSIATLIGQFLPDASRVYCDWPRPGPQTVGCVELPAAQRNRQPMKYFIYLPEDYAADRPGPLLLYLHGSGQRGDDVNQVLQWGLPQLIGAGLRVPMIVISPQCQANASWDVGQLLALVDHLETRFAIDPDRIYITGESMGGYGTWALIAAAPERFAAAAPVCGGGEVEQAGRMLGLPIWAFHGAEDKVVPLEQSRKMVDAVQAAGGDARLTVFPGQGHGITDSVYARGDLFRWLLNQKRHH